MLLTVQSLLGPWEVAGNAVVAARVSSARCIKGVAHLRMILTLKVISCVVHRDVLPGNEGLCWPETTAIEVVLDGPFVCGPAAVANVSRLSECRQAFRTCALEPQAAGEDEQAFSMPHLLASTGLL